MSILTDIATRIDDQGAATLNTNLFRGRMPDEPDECVSLQTFSGDESRIRDADYLAADERANVQVMVRSLYQGAAETLAEAVWDAAQFRSETLTSGRFYPYVRAPQFPSYLGVDDRGRHMLVFTLEVRRLRSNL